MIGYLDLGTYEGMPYTNLHSLNLTRIIMKINELIKDMNDFEATTKMTYMGDWDITKNYPSWSIVVDNSGGSTIGYLSLKPVPKNVNITDTNYWAMIADFSAIYADLGTRLTSLETIVNNIIAMLSDDDIIEDPYAVWIGDSYTAAGSLGADQNKRFATLVSNAIGYREFNYAVGGCGYVEGTTPYSVQAANAIADFTTNNRDKSKVRKIFICGMRNDSGTYSTNTYGTAVNSVLSPLSAYFDKATIIIIPDLFDWKCMPLSYLRNVNIIKSYAEDYPKTRVIDKAYEWLIGMGNHVLYQGGADVHPDVYGHRVITSHILSALCGNNYSHSDHYEFVPTSTHADVSNCTCELTINNSVAHFRVVFDCSDFDNLISENVLTFTFNSLSLRSLYFLRDKYFAEIHGRTEYYPAKCTVQETITKTDDTTGSLTLTVYCYQGGSFESGNTKFYIDFSIPYGLQYTDLTFN